MSMSSQQHVPAIWNKKSNNKHEEKIAGDSSSDEEPQVRMRVGDMYQAKVPRWEDNSDSEKTNSKEGMLIWSPNEIVSDDKLNSFCQIAKDKHSYNIEQALGMLFWHKHDIKKSLNDMQNFTPMPDEWSSEDKVLFEQAYTFHGKNFRKIQQLIPDKEISQLVKHYYTWKKTRMMTSLMDKQATKRRHDNDSDDSPMDDEDELLVAANDAPPVKQLKADNDAECKHKLHKDIQLTVDDIEVFSNNAKGAKGYLESLDQELVELKRQVQESKQECGKLTSKLQGVSPPFSFDTQPPAIEGNPEERKLKEKLFMLSKMLEKTKTGKTEKTE